MTPLDLTDYPRLPFTDISDPEIVDRGLAGQLPCGQYAVVLPRRDVVYLARDPVGSSKLFFGRDGRGGIVIANRAVRVWRSGCPLTAIASCPPGHVVQVDAGETRLVGGAPLTAIPADEGFDTDEFIARSRALLGAAFEWLAASFDAARFVICLSGGLDSSIVGSFAVAHLSNVTAASFTYLDADDLQRYALGAAPAALASASDDFRSAAAVAGALGVPLLPVIRPREAVPAAVAPAVCLGQDWRDFNVHCATVNLFLAQDIRTAFPGERVVVLTGDLMNEYVADYKEEWVGDTVYYKLPRIPVDKRRHHFVRGLDTGDREIGIFAAFGLIACQPFAALAEHYMRIPGAALAEAGAKWSINRALLAPQAAAHVSRSKTRAQVGGADLGTLGIYHRLGIDEARLRQLWREQFPGEPTQTCDDFIQFGRYKLPGFGPDARTARE